MWLQSYLEQLFTCDAQSVGPSRDPERLRRFFEAYALNSAGVVPAKSIYEAAGINFKTAEAYKRLLENLVIVKELPAWSTNRLRRLVRTPKRSLVVTSLAAAALHLDVAGVMRDGDLLGRLLDSFVTTQLRAEMAVSDLRPRLYHLRQENGHHEIDIIVELGGGRVVGIEVKASNAPTPSDARHLCWLRDQLGDRFVVGVVLHTGRWSYPLGAQVMAAPICTLWEKAQRELALWD